VSVVREWLSGAGVFLYSDGGARTLMAHHANRPTKICVVCGRPFQWRKKWKTVWDEVTYCSDLPKPDVYFFASADCQLTMREMRP